MPRIAIDTIEPEARGALRPIPPPPNVEPPRWPRVAALVGGVLLIAAGGYAAWAVVAEERPAEDDAWAQALANAERRPPEVAAVAPRGTLIVRADTAGGAGASGWAGDVVVWVDEQVVGPPPVSVGELRPGLHILRVEWGGRTVLDSLVYVRRGDVAEVLLAAPAAEAAPQPRRRARARRSSSRDRDISEALERLGAAPALAPVPLRAAEPRGGAGGAGRE